MGQVIGVKEETPDQEVLELLRQGRSTDAIKEYRVKTGVSLKEAHDYAEKLKQSG